MSDRFRRIDDICPMDARCMFEAIPVFIRWTFDKCDSRYTFAGRSIDFSWMVDSCVGLFDTCPLEFHWTLVGFARDIHWIWVTCSLHVCWNLRRSFAAWSLRFRWIFVTFPSDFRWRLAGCSLDLCGVAADCMLCRMPVGCSLDLCLIFTWASRGCSLNLCKV